jgi:hypothetical protein
VSWRRTPLPDDDDRLRLSTGLVAQPRGKVGEDTNLAASIIANRLGKPGTVLVGSVVLAAATRTATPPTQRRAGSGNRPHPGPAARRRAPAAIRAALVAAYPYGA